MSSLPTVLFVKPRGNSVWYFSGVMMRIILCSECRSQPFWIPSFLWKVRCLFWDLCRAVSGGCRLPVRSKERRKCTVTQRSKKEWRRRALFRREGWIIPMRRENCDYTECLEQNREPKHERHKRSQLKHRWTWSDVEEWHVAFAGGGRFSAAQ